MTSGVWLEANVSAVNVKRAQASGRKQNPAILEQLKVAQ
jgi:hypothetical protein